MKNNARKIAIKILRQIEVDEQFSHLTLKEILHTSDVSDIDRRFIVNIVYGVLENKLLLDFYIRKLSSTRFGKINHEIVNVLRTGLYQLAFMDRVPDSAAVNESVKLAKKVAPHYGGFVNGILRSFIRADKKIELPDRKKHPLTYLSIRYSHPEWMVSKWVEAYGESFAEELLKANNNVPDLWIRVNTLKINPEALMATLEEAGVEVEQSSVIKDAIRIKSLNENAIDKLVGYKEGWFTVQDISSMCVAEISEVAPGDFVVDVCAAPGGKSTHLAQKMNNKGTIISRDLYPQKLDLIKETRDRLGIEIIETQVFDAMQFDDRLLDKADTVLVDAPCSGFGIIRRKPDIKYNRTIEDIGHLIEMQYKILETSSSYVKKGGYLIYSTCTINTDENAAIVEKFLDHHPQYDLVKITGVPWVNDQGMVELYPNLQGTDGFFIAKMKKRE